MEAGEQDFESANDDKIICQLIILILHELCAIAVIFSTFPLTHFPMRQKVDQSALSTDSTYLYFLVSRQIYI